ncbi:hypothetical protein [Streptosporangium sp. NPDC006007]
MDGAAPFPISSRGGGPAVRRGSGETAARAAKGEGEVGQVRRERGP